MLYIYRDYCHLSLYIRHSKGCNSNGEFIYMNKFFIMFNQVIDIIRLKEILSAI